MDTLKRLWPQLWPSPQALLTESTLPSQSGKVVLITGSTAGVGYELARILYKAGAKVYMAVRSEDKAAAVIDAITTAKGSADGSIKYLHLDYNDLSTVKRCAEAFLAESNRLDVLFNNAGIANVPPSKTTEQGLEPHMGVNCVGAFLLTSLLEGRLAYTAAIPGVEPNSVRVIWSSSMLVDAMAPPEGVPPAELNAPSRDRNRNYAVSKAGNWFLATRFAKRLGPKGVVSITQNPGNLHTAIFDDTPKIIVWASLPVFYKAIDGAHTALWAAFAKEITVADGGRYVIPWGKWHPNPRQDLIKAMKDQDESGLGYAKDMEDWCEKVVAAYR